MSNDAAPRAELAHRLETEFPGATVTPIAGDASSRSFFRVTSESATHVVMDYGRPFEGETDDVRLARVFAAAKLPVATVLEIVPDPGFLLLEDLGERTLEEALADAPDESTQRLYEDAVDLAVSIAERGTAALAASDRADGPVLDAERFRFEMDFFLEHFATGLRGLAAPSDPLRDALHRLADTAAETPARVLCHRDYHSRNLMVRRDGSLAMVDIQDARWGSDTYDLTSLLRDAYVDLDEQLVERMIERYRSQLSAAPERDAFRRRFDVTAAQRMIKALGTFGYQVTELGRRRYLDAVPRTAARLDRLLPAREETVELHRLLTEIGLLV